MLSGCANAQPIEQGATTTSRGPGVDAPSIDWENPINGEVVNDLTALDGKLPFDPVEPGGLGAPTKILVGPVGSDNASLVVAFLYESSDAGLVVVKEHLPDVPAKEYESANRQLLELNGQPNVHGSFEIVTIRSGAEALITTSEDASTSSIFWLEDGIEFIVRGPGLDRERAVQVAEKL
jgi:hypothetical protein